MFRVLHEADAPLSHREACDALGDVDRITVFRNLVALVEAELAVRLDVGDRVWRYAPADGEHAEHDARHPHFTCTTCGDVVCLDDVRVEAAGASAALLDGAEIQIKGTCDTCR